MSSDGLWQVDNFDELLHRLKNGQPVLFPWEHEEKIQCTYRQWGEWLQQLCADCGVIIDFEHDERGSVTAAWDTTNRPTKEVFEAALRELERYRESQAPLSRPSDTARRDGPP